ncbi:hypothetical protein BC828DRAFT_373258 [Blastocladiella britannica]|nr:hypothetical protein BC828DRAFT_373258 [Blastocladiella britannica]
MAADPKCEILLHSLDPILPFAELVDLASKIPALAHILSSFIRASSEPHMVDLDVLHFFKKHLPVRLVPNFLAGLEVYPGDQGFWELEAQNCTTAISHYLEKLRSALPEHQQQLLLSSGETYGSGNGGGGGGAADGHKSSSQRSTVRSRGGGLSRSTTPTASLVTTTPFEALVAPPEISLLGSLAFFSSLACKAQIWSPATAAWWKASLPALEALEGGKFAAVGEDAALPRGTLALMLLDVLVGSLVAPPVTSAQPPRSNGARGSTVRVKAKVGGPDGWECLAIARSAEAVVGAAHAGSGVAAAPISTHIADTLLAIVTKLTAASRSFAYGGVVDHVVRRRYKPFEPSDSNANSPAKSAAALAVANDARTLHHAPAVVAFPALAATLARVTSRIPPDTLTQAVMGELPIHPIASLGALCAGPLGAALDSLPELREVFALGVAAAMASPSRIQMAGLTPLYPHLITFSAGASQAGRSLSGHGPATGAIYLRAVAADLLAAQPSLPAWTYFRALTHALPAPGTMGTGTVAAAESADAALLRHLAALVMATVAYHVTRPDAAGWVRQVARDLVYAERVRPSATFWHAVAAVVVSNWPAAVPETADLEELAGMESANTMEEF